MQDLSPLFWCIGPGWHDSRAWGDTAELAGAAVVTKFGDRYELIRRIGAGGMGEVWLAHDEELADRPVAIKIMHQHMLPNADDVARFEREMRFAAMMDHPNIVTVYTTGTWDEAPFMVMEYLQGTRPGTGTPRRGRRAYRRDRPGHLRRPRVRPPAGRDPPGHQAGQPVPAARAGRSRSPTSASPGRSTGRRSAPSGWSSGTLAFLPPERWRGEPPAFSNDIWAVGCVLYRLISGRLPRLLPDVADYAAAAMRGDPFPDLRDITDAPGWLAGRGDGHARRRPRAAGPPRASASSSLSSAQFPAPAPGLPARSRHLPGQLGPARPTWARSPARPARRPGDRAGDATGCRAAGRRPLAAGGPRRPGRRRPAASCCSRDRSPHGGSAACRGPRLAASGATTTPAASHAAAATPWPPPGRATRSRSAAAAPRPSTAAAAPATSRSVTQASSRPASPASSPAAPPLGSPSASPHAPVPRPARRPRARRPSCRYPTWWA